MGNEDEVEDEVMDKTEDYVQSFQLVRVRNITKRKGSLRRRRKTIIQMVQQPGKDSYVSPTKNSEDYFPSKAHTPKEIKGNLEVSATKTTDTPHKQPPSTTKTKDTPHKQPPSTTKTKDTPHKQPPSARKTTDTPPKQPAGGNGSPVNPGNMDSLFNTPGKIIADLKLGEKESE